MTTRINDTTNNGLADLAFEEPAAYVLSNPLTTPLLQTIRVVGRLRQEITGLLEVIQSAVALLSDRDLELEKVRDQNKYLRAQVRAAASGRSLAAERADLDRCSLDILIDEPKDESKAANRVVRQDVAA